MMIDGSMVEMGRRMKEGGGVVWCGVVWSGVECYIVERSSTE